MEKKKVYLSKNKKLLKEKLENEQIDLEKSKDLILNIIKDNKNKLR